MRGYLYYGNRDIRFSDKVPEPEIRIPTDVIINVAWCGICGSDLHEYLDGPIFFPKPGQGHELSNKKVPLCMGHEFSGTVKEVGSAVTRVKPGDRVVIEATAHCSDRKRYPDGNPRANAPFCTACKRGLPNICAHGSFTGLGFSDGAMSERVAVGQDHVLPIPDSIPLDVGALCEPLSVAWHAVRLSGFKEGASALVLGAGPIGLCTILALQGHKAGRIVVSEPADIRRKQAEKLGVDDSFNPATVKGSDPDLELKAYSDKEGNGFDFTFDASGIQVTLTAAIRTLAPRGKAMNIAIWPDKNVNIKPMDLTWQEKEYTGSLGYVTQDFKEVIDALSTGLISVEKAKNLITGKVELEDAKEKGFMELINHKATNIKILITPNKI